MGGGLERARADLARGEVRRARDRLKGLVVAYPEDVEVRALLAEAYRRDRQWTEAGRWGYLDGGAASESECAAFEQHCGFGWGSRITESRLRRLLRSRDLATIADATGRARLRRLPRKRPGGPRAGRREGVVASARRLLALARSWLVWR